ncbi:helix-turn-helix domain-containing protein [Actinomadura chokoriensis]|uniref:Helix-turn-helix domain-containing protein n=1 Tax=Actinomadura chokoriensis TaxID=454156 RepID=A0ABV4R946_9ACTN
MTDERQIPTEVLVILRRLLVQHRAQPNTYRGLLLVDTLVHDYRGRVDATGVGVSDPGIPSWFLTTTEVAEILHVTPDAVRKACRLGTLTGRRQPGSREWRIDPAAVAEYRAA